MCNCVLRSLGVDDAQIVDHPGIVYIESDGFDDVIGQRIENHHHTASRADIKWERERQILVVVSDDVGFQRPLWDPHQQLETFSLKGLCSLPTLKHFLAVVIHDVLLGCE